MAIPDYQAFMLPLLKFLSDEKEHSLTEYRRHLIALFNLTEEEKRKLVPSGGQTVIDNRVGWARTYLKKACLIEYPKRGHAKITERGVKFLDKKLEKITITILEQFEEFVQFRTIKNDEKPETQKDLIAGDADIEDITPDELIEQGYELIHSDLLQEILDKLLSNSPDFFEIVVLQLLSKMGYGEGAVVGRSGDGGVDGFINQDKLGLDKIFFQAKRFARNNPVTASMLRDFVGALDLKGVAKGVFITTSKFPSNAEVTLSGSPKSIVLINGQKLAKLMSEYGLGVSIEKTYSIKRIDSDFFPEE
ncbi:MAG: winged helix-turn-helix domain-containing protein [Candidatus Saelkia tenebricola]|nr:winged helix-turn-helix domain-containing protein [Candidatus Saelkia tenebricola]